MQSYERDLARPKAIARHHAMRIAAKRLRYSLEVFEPLYGRPLKGALRCAKELQTLLGELHDCDVWVATLPGFLAGNVAPAAEEVEAVARPAGDIEAFRRDRMRRRQTVYRQCRRYWRQCRKERVWLKLREILARAAPPTSCCGASGRSSASTAARCGTRGT
jgi:CHAD domain-containing protein